MSPKTKTFYDIKEVGDEGRVLGGTVSRELSSEKKAPIVSISIQIHNPVSRAEVDALLTRIGNFLISYRADDVV